MKKIIFFGWLVLFLPALGFAQEKVEASVWNPGDKWVFDRGGPMEVVGCNAQCFLVRFSGECSPGMPPALPSSIGQLSMSNI